MILLSLVMATLYLSLPHLPLWFGSVSKQEHACWQKTEHIRTRNFFTMLGIIVSSIVGYYAVKFFFFLLP
jgi:hypothetical protein